MYDIRWKLFLFQLFITIYMCSINENFIILLLMNLKLLKKKFIEELLWYFNCFMDKNDEKNKNIEFDEMKINLLIIIKMNFIFFIDNKFINWKY